jgi:hypothetical protein
MVVLAVAGACAGSPQRRYDFGVPSREEQRLWYLVNRARRDPAAEGRRLASSETSFVDDAIDGFGVDRATLIADFHAISATPPLAWNASLAAAARTHAIDQATSGQQSHLGSDGSRPADRVRRTGLDFDSLQEVVYSAAHSPDYAAAAFLVDWGGPAPSGVQQWPDPPHRHALLSSDTTRLADSIGIAWVVADPAQAAIGPNVVVAEIAAAGGTFIVGTVWEDLNGNGGLDDGEGVGGVTVRPDTGRWYAVTASAGMFELPTADPGPVTLEVTVGDSQFSWTLEVGDVNVSADLMLPDPG